MSAATTTLATLERTFAMLDQSIDAAREAIRTLAAEEPTTDGVDLEALQEALRIKVTHREVLIAKRWGINLALGELRAAIEQEAGVDMSEFACEECGWGDGLHATDCRNA